MQNDFFTGKEKEYEIGPFQKSFSAARVQGGCGLLGISSCDICGSTSWKLEKQNGEFCQGSELNIIYKVP